METNRLFLAHRSGIAAGNLPFAVKRQPLPGARRLGIPKIDNFEPFG